LHSRRSDRFPVRFGVREGSILSPILFAVYLNDNLLTITQLVTRLSYFMLMILLLVTFSITELQRLFDACQRELCW